MKFLRIPCFVAAFLTLLRSASGQSFVNLNFECSKPFNTTQTGYGFETGTARVPGWTDYGDFFSSNYLGSTYIWYNNQTLDNPGVSLEGTNYWTPAISGKYSIYLWGGDVDFHGAGPGATAIGQTGQIPLGTQSITYWGLSRLNPYHPYQDFFQITFAGHILNFSDLADTPNYTLYGADISAFAGQTGELRFSATWNSGLPGMIDNIQLSAMAIPDPSVLRVFYICLFSFCWQWQRIKTAGRGTRKGALNGLS